MDKTALNIQLVITRLRRRFYHLKSVDCRRSDLWKILVANGKNERLDVGAC